MTMNVRFTKTIAGCLLLCSAHSGLAAGLVLRGIAGMCGEMRALVELEPENVRESTAWTLSVGQRGEALEIVRILPAEGSVQALYKGESVNLNLLDSCGSSTNQLCLHQASFTQTLGLYEDCSGRTVLLHPNLVPGRFSIQRSFRDNSEAVSVLEELFRQDGIAIIRASEKFVLMISSRDTNGWVGLQTNSLAGLRSPGEIIPAGMVEFRNTPAVQVMTIFGEFVGKKLELPSTLPYRQVTFRNRTPLSRAELASAIETLLFWNGFRLVETSEGVLRVTFEPG